MRELGLLDSACHRPRLGFLGEDAYPAVRARAAPLMHFLVLSYALLDGNKRLALLATVVFLRINGYRLALSDDEAFDPTIAVAEGRLEAEEIGKRMRLKPVTG